MGAGSLCSAEKNGGTLTVSVLGDAEGCGCALDAASALGLGHRIGFSNAPVMRSPTICTLDTLPARTWSRKVEYGISASCGPCGHNASMFHTISPVRISHHSQMLLGS